MPVRMTGVLVFAALQLLVTIYAWWRGGWPERTVGVAMVAAILAGWALPFEPRTAYRHVELGQLSIDGLLWLVIYGVGLKADRYWPIWMGAIFLLAIGIHGVRGYDEQLLPIAYHKLIEWTSYLMILLLVVGTFRHHERTTRHPVAVASG